MFRDYQIKNILHHILLEEKEEFRQSLIKSFQLTSVEPQFQNGNVVYKVPFKRESVTRLLTDNNSTCIDSSHTMLNAYDLLQLVTHDFINIPANASVRECLNIIYPFYVKAENHFYGVLLRSTTDPDIIINPFHILTTLSLLEETEFLETHKFNILIYVYKDRAAADRIFSTHLADNTRIDTNIKALMQTFTSKLETETLLTDISDISPDEVKIEYQETVDKDEERNYSHRIVTHQVLAKGIIAPFYGTSLIRWKRGSRATSGIHLSPFRSSNLQGSSITSKENADNIRSYEVCTGREEKVTIKGLQTLTHSNLSSPYQLQCIAVGALAYADAMIAASIDIYKAAGIFRNEVLSTKIKLQYSPEELACKTLTEFIKLKQTKATKVLPLMALTKAWQELQQTKTNQTSGDSDENQTSKNQEIEFQDQN